jgi:hypothetical protein
MSIGAICLEKLGKQNKIAHMLKGELLEASLCLHFNWQLENLLWIATESMCTSLYLHRALWNGQYVSEWDHMVDRIIVFQRFPYVSPKNQWIHYLI